MGTHTIRDCEGCDTIIIATGKKYFPGDSNRARAFVRKKMPSAKSTSSKTPTAITPKVNRPVSARSMLTQTLLQAIEERRLSQWLKML
ncbi:MAG: hypothetical protein ACD_9C00176G0002 [uncultured bacterium]|nr:MAG: hypothetical protein ACD_9C00176G0002 [uncultured bacterium]KKQ45418.1 MAG: hypothetical protein US63_C0017G0017 [Candidatus Moranbacteria bacterium GW2011_GWC2_37_8]KKQ63381.1 MAG: hypothetical protein US82_C0001G0050 [Parcubacteria group bacterium GW2011_GWC1_38_22]